MKITEFAIIRYITTDDCPKDKVFLIPMKLKCKICGDDAYMVEGDRVTCINVNRIHDTKLSDYAKQFGVIQNVSFSDESDSGRN